MTVQDSHPAKKYATHNSCEATTARYQLAADRALVTLHDALQDEIRNRSLRACCIQLDTPESNATQLIARKLAQLSDQLLTDQPSTTVPVDTGRWATLAAGILREKDTRLPLADLVGYKGIQQPGILRVLVVRDRGRQRLSWLLGITSDQRPAAGVQLALAQLQEHLSLRALGAMSSEAMLSRRESECMNWVLAGKSSKQIADGLALHTATVNEYIRSATHKLRANNRTHAACRALQLGMLTVAIGN